MRGERHGSALLFWCECSRSWGKWGVCGGSCLRRNDGEGRGNDGGVDALRRVRAAARPLVDARGLSPPT